MSNRWLGIAAALLAVAYADDIAAAPNGQGDPGRERPLEVCEAQAWDVPIVIVQGLGFSS